MREREREREREGGGGGEGGKRVSGVREHVFVSLRAPVVAQMCLHGKVRARASAHVCVCVCVYV